MWIQKEKLALREMQISKEVSTSSGTLGSTSCQFDLNSEVPSVENLKFQLRDYTCKYMCIIRLGLKLQPRQYTYKFAGKLVSMVPRLRDEKLSLPDEVLNDTMNTCDLFFCLLS